MNKLREAVLAIKEECSKHDRCMDCPLHDTRYWECGVSNNAVVPNEWEIASDDPLKIFIE